jgi:hypothetical protein
MYLQEVYLPLHEAWDTYGGMENWTEVRKQALFDHKVKTKCSNRSKQGWSDACSTPVCMHTTSLGTIAKMLLMTLASHSRVTSAEYAQML